MNERRQQYLHALDLTCFKLKETLDPALKATRDDTPALDPALKATRDDTPALDPALKTARDDTPALDPALKATRDDTPAHDTSSLDSTLNAAGNDTALESSWTALQNKVSTCTACSLHQSRTQTVFGVGNHQAELMIIGEAPGFYEDQKGEPFVGRAGQLLNAMLEAIHFTRSSVYIANILKCRPPNNRDPQPDEVAQCTGFLQQQIALIQPKLLLAVGRIAAHYLLQTKSSLETLRGKIHTFGEKNTPLIITYHPAYLLRNPKDKAKAYVDLQLTYRTLHL